GRHHLELSRRQRLDARERPGGLRRGGHRRQDRHGRRGQHRGVRLVAGGRHRLLAHGQAPPRPRRHDLRRGPRRPTGHGQHDQGADQGRTGLRQGHLGRRHPGRARRLLRPVLRDRRSL
ncbi:MAG: hypothetical protein AVDCRST_MAG32-524, partial [uncultured Nocardioides sp.]